MKVRIDLQKGIKLADGTTPRWVLGDFDPATGVLWLDEEQAPDGPRSHRIMPGQFLHMPSRSSGQRLDLSTEGTKAKAPKVKGATA